MSDASGSGELFADWIGREQAASEHIDAELVRRYRATLWNEASQPAGDVPLGLHWCLAPQIADRSQIGADGHPVRGLHLPPIALPRRMWASSALDFHDALRIGDRVERRSRITSITNKVGSTGPLCFLTVLHQVTTSRGPAITETQTIVYRDNQPAGAAVTPTPATALPAGARALELDSDPVLLFRFSALTFNSHRIHYDAAYARDEEGYPGLVVHGPLQAALLLNFAADQIGPLRQFRFRAVSPLICNRRFQLVAAEEPGQLALSVVDEAGTVTMQAAAL
jgi:3-methylfumaryl-CoA hydratase